MKLEISHVYSVTIVSKNKKNLKNPAIVKSNLTRDYEHLGSSNFHEISIIVLFIVLILLWCLRDPGFIQGC